MFLEEDKEEMKKKILSAYCFQKPDSKFAQIVDKLGIEVAIKFVDEFFGEVLAIPTRNALKRAALPKIINDDLEGLKSESNQFKNRVKNLSAFYGLRKKAIIEMNETGKYSR